MALVKNATFQGASLYEVDPGSVTLTTTVKNVQGDAAAILERLTDKTVADDIDHSGPGRGCVLGIPPVNQLVNKSLELGGTPGFKDGGFDDDRLQFPWFVYVPPGETDLVVEVTFGTGGVDLDLLAPSCRLSSPTSFTTLVADTLDATMTGIESSNGVDGFTRCRTRFTGLTAGLALLMVSCAQTARNVVIGDTLVSETTSIRDVVVRFGRGPSARIDNVYSSTNNTPVQTPTASQALFFQQMDDALFVNGEALTGFHTSRLDANLNALAEFLTASPAFGNATYTHTESALLAPTRDRFRAFTRKTFANEPLPKIPVASHNFGGVKDTGYWLVDPATPASVTDRKAYAPYATSSASVELGSGRAHCPDVPSGTMRWAVLVGQSASVAAGFTNVRAQVQMEGATASALVTPTAVTGATFLGIAQGTALAFTRDSPSNRLRVFLSQAAGVFDSRNYCLLAAAVWIEE
jgi:hypothetical protein